MGSSPFEIAVISVIIAGFFVTIIKRRSIDKCIKDYKNDLVTIVMPNGEEYTGIMDPESTGIEIKLTNPTKNKKSLLIYKKEIDLIPAIYRYHEMLSEKADLERQLELKKTYHPNLFRRAKRKVSNLFKTFRDSLVELLNMIIGQQQTSLPEGSALGSQKKQIDKVKNEALNATNTAFEPLLEKYIGNKVVVKYSRTTKEEEIIGILKEYSNKFIEIVDTIYNGQKVDLILPRSKAYVRHLAEDIDDMLK